PSRVVTLTSFGSPGTGLSGVVMNSTVGSNSGFQLENVTSL
ncbi:MAG: hypothetical protein K0Q60_2098, partial [Microvirga sp.]|nr:hypothetical protein [Microvirga sp.]